ncbi:hypothetical protein SNN74_003368 [Cronobacter turicensis]|nr:hypothetical protein [Cronobacter turicensis]
MSHLARYYILFSASKAQKQIFKHYLINFAKEVVVELEGDPMMVSNVKHNILTHTFTRYPLLG